MKKAKTLLSLLLIASLLFSCNSKKPDNNIQRDQKLSKTDITSEDLLTQSDGIPEYYECEPFSFSENAPKVNNYNCSCINGRYYMMANIEEKAVDSSQLYDVYYDGTMHPDESKLPEDINSDIDPYTKAIDIMDEAGISHDKITVGSRTSDTHGNNYITVYDKGKPNDEIYLYKISPENKIVSETYLESAFGTPGNMFIDKNGDLNLLNNDGQSFVISIYNGETFELKDTFEFHNVICGILGSVGEYEITYETEDGFYGFDMDTNVNDLLVSYSDYYNISIATVKDEKAYFDVSKEGTIIYSENMDGSDGKMITLSDTIEYYNSLLYISETDDIYIILLDSNEWKYTVYKVDNNGKLKNICEISYNNSFMYADEKGNIYFWDNEKQCVCVYSADGQNSNIDIGSDGKLIDKFYITQNNRAFVICYEAGNGSHIYELDKKTMKLIDTKFVYSSDISSRYDFCNCSVPGYDFTYISDNKLIGYSVDKNTSDIIVDLLKNNIDMDRIELQYVDNNSYLLKGTDKKNNNLAYYTLKPMSKEKLSQIQNLKTISVAALGMDMSIVNDQILKFNNDNNGYRADIKNYSNGSKNIEESVEKFNNDIAAGNIPDVIITGPECDMTQYINKGMMTDLYSFIDNDTEFGRDDFIPEILEAMEYDKKLYSISPDFDLLALIGKESVIGDSGSCSYNDFFSIVKNNSDKLLNWQAEYDQMAKQYLSTYIEDYVDLQNGKCNFNNDVFVDLIKIIKENGFSHEEMKEFEKTIMSNDNYINQFKNNQIIFSNDKLQVEKFFTLQDEISDKLIIKDYPSNQKNKSLILTNMNFYITTKSENSNEAWEFIKNFLREDSLLKIDINGDGFCYGYPIVKQILNTYLDEKSYRVSRDDDTKRKEFVDLTMNIIGSKHVVYNSHNNIMKIINDNLVEFYAGSESAEDAAASIENKVKLYLSEVK